MEKYLEEQVQRQIKYQKHNSHKVDLKIGTKKIETIEVPRKVFKDFEVHKGVFNPLGFVSEDLAAYLSENYWLYKDKIVADMGTGTGIQACVMVDDAKFVYATDDNKNAIQNVGINLDKFSSHGKVSKLWQGNGFFCDKYHIRYSSIFAEYRTMMDIKHPSFDLIVANHPFFSINSKGTLTHAMANQGYFIRKFLDLAKYFLSHDGKILMPFLEIAGEENHPFNRGKEFGYNVEMVYHKFKEKGIQKGPVSIYMLSM